MKYLKLFNERIDNSVLQDTREILLDFTDSGNEAYVDWVDSRYKDEIVIVLKNKNVNLDVDTLVRLFTYMKNLGFQCNYIFCQHPVNVNQFDEYRTRASDKIYILQSAKDFNLHMDIKSINSWNVLELVFHKMKTLEKFESIYESPYVIELKDMSLELNDMGFTVQVFKEQQESDKRILVVITNPNDFTMTDDVKDFILRTTSYMKDNGFEYKIHSNFGTVHQSKEGELYLNHSTHTHRQRTNLGKSLPTLSMINLIFNK